MDSSWVDGESIGSIAGILHDSSGIMVDGFAKEIYASSSLQAETLALRQGLILLKQREARHEGEVLELGRSWLCESDSRTLVESVLGREVAPWAVQDQVQECQEILARLTNARVTFCPREANHAVDWVAKAHRLNLLPSNWQREPPTQLWTILCSDFNLSLPCKARRF